MMIRMRMGSRLYNYKALKTMGYSDFRSFKNFGSLTRPVRFLCRHRKPGSEFGMLIIPHSQLFLT